MGFYDAKGYWRNDGEGFYDAKGYWVKPGCGFYDYKGCWRNPGDGFYDAKGYWVNPGGSFYDGKGTCRNYVVDPDVVIANKGTDIVEAVGFILFLPIGILWFMVLSLISWITTHVYIVYMGYCLLDAIVCLSISISRKQRRGNMALSFFGNFMCILSFIYIALIYAIPNAIAEDGSFGSMIEMAIVLAFCAGIIAVIQFFNYYHQKPLLEFVIGIVFFVLTIALFKERLNVINSMEELAQIYNLKSTVMFKILFGFAV